MGGDEIKRSRTSEELMEAIKLVLLDIGSGFTIRAALDNRSVNQTSFFEYLDKYPLLADQFARAQASKAELGIEQCEAIADNPDINPNQARNMIEIRKWYAERIKRSKYGQQVTIDVNQKVSIREALEEARSRIRGVIEISPTQIAESTVTISNCTTGSQPVESDKNDGIDSDERPKSPIDDLLD